MPPPRVGTTHVRGFTPYQHIAEPGTLREHHELERGVRIDERRVDSRGRMDLVQGSGAMRHGLYLIEARNTAQRAGGRPTGPKPGAANRFAAAIPVISVSPHPARVPRLLRTQSQGIPIGLGSAQGLTWRQAGQNQSGGYVGGQRVAPLIGELDADDRWHEIGAEPGSIFAVPAGVPGCLLQDSNEGDQALVFIPAGGWLACASEPGGTPEFARLSTLVYDLDQDGKLSDAKAARLHSALEVFPVGRGYAGNFYRPANFRGTYHGLAWQLGQSAPDGAAGYGLAIGNAQPEAFYLQTRRASRVGGLFAAGSASGGPCSCGSRQDKHALIESPERINQGHIDVCALFHLTQEFDGPLDFKDSYKQQAAQGAKRAPVNLVFDRTAKHITPTGLRDGVWRWQALTDSGYSEGADHQPARDPMATQPRDSGSGGYGETTERSDGPRDNVTSACFEVGSNYFSGTDGRSTSGVAGSGGGGGEPPEPVHPEDDLRAHVKRVPEPGRAAPPWFADAKIYPSGRQPLRTVREFAGHGGVRPDRIPGVVVDARAAELGLVPRPKDAEMRKPTVRTNPHRPGAPQRWDVADTPHDFAVPALLGRPARTERGVVDERHERRIHSGTLRAHEQRAPIVHRAEAIGQRTPGQRFVHTRRWHQSPYPAGSGPGMIYEAPPEIDPAFIDDRDRATDIAAFAAGEVSESGRVLHPLVALGFGYPNTDRSQIKDGWVVSNGNQDNELQITPRTADAVDPTRRQVTQGVVRVAHPTSGFQVDIDPTAEVVRVTGSSGDILDLNASNGTVRYPVKTAQPADLVNGSTWIENSGGQRRLRLNTTVGGVESVVLA